MYTLKHLSAAYAVHMLTYNQEDKQYKLLETYAFTKCHYDNN